MISSHCPISAVTPFQSPPKAIKISALFGYEMEALYTAVATRALAMVRQTTGCQTRVVIDAACPAAGSCRHAIDADDLSHRIVVRASSTIDYTIVHESAHLLLIDDAIKSGCYIRPTIAQSNLENICQSMNRHETTARWDRLDATLYGESVVNGLFNLPADVLVERWIACTFPELRALQSRRIREYICAETGACLADAGMPTLVRDVSIAVISAAGVHLTDLLSDADRAAMHRSVGGLDQGVQRTVAQLVERASLPLPWTYAAHCMMTDRWAELLGCRSWYSWERIIVPDYLGGKAPR